MQYSILIFFLACPRIAFGKFLNCGQTCVGVDYVICDAEIVDKFIEKTRFDFTLTKMLARARYKDILQKQSQTMTN